MINFKYITENPLNLESKGKCQNFKEHEKAKDNSD